MKDKGRTKEDLINDLAELRRQVAELKESESNHKLLTESLNESIERFRAVFETAQDCIFLKDRDFKYTLVNPTFEKIFGLPASKLVGLTDKELFGLEIAKHIWEEDARVLAGESLEVEHTKPVNGVINTFDIIRVPLFDGSGSVTGICGIARNITDRKMAEDALIKINARLQTLIDTIPDIVYFKNLQGRNLVVNSAFEELVGMGRADIVGKTDEELFPLELARQCMRSDDEVVRNGKARRCEEQVVDKKGNKIFFESIKTPLYDKHENIVGLVGVSRNITERKTAEESLKESTERLRSLTVHLQTLQEKERRRIAGDIHDEFGQVFTALNYDLSWMRKKLPDDRRDLIEMTEKMSKLIDNGIRTVQKISSELRPALLDELGLVPAIEWHAEEYEKRTGICCEVDAAAGKIILDKDLSTAVFRVFQEALTNVARHANATKVNITLKESKGKLFLKVTDNGRGITKKEISSPKAFGLTGIKERFYPWGGEVRIAGVRGKGTEITVCIPFDKDRKKRDYDKNSHCGRPPRGSRGA